MERPNCKREGFWFHFGASLTAVMAAWFLQLMVYKGIAWDPSGHDTAVWMIWSGGFSIVGWLLVGIPIAALRPLIRSRWQAIVMIPVSGFIGLLLPFIVFRTWGVISINPMSMFVFFTAAVAMMIYLLLARRQHNPPWLRHTSTSKRTAGALHLTGDDSSEEQSC